MENYKDMVAKSNLDVIFNDGNNRVLQLVKFDSKQPFNGLYFRVQGENPRYIDKMIMDFQEDRKSIYLCKMGRKVVHFTPTRGSQVISVVDITEITGNELVLYKYWDSLIEENRNLCIYERNFLKDISWKEPIYKEFLKTFNL